MCEEQAENSVYKIGRRPDLVYGPAYIRPASAHRAHMSRCCSPGPAAAPPGPQLSAAEILRQQFESFLCSLPVGKQSHLTDHRATFLGVESKATTLKSPDGTAWNAPCSAE